MFIQLKIKIWATVLTIVLLFAFFTFYYFPKQQGDFLLKNYNNEVQNLANTVALGVKIALNEQDYEGVETALEYVKGNPGLKFVSLVQSDTVWNEKHTGFSVHDKIFKTFPENIVITDLNKLLSDSMIIKRAPFNSSVMSGAILLGFTTQEINESKRNIRFASLGVSGIIFFVGFLISYFLSRKISMPVIALRNAANKVSEGDLTQVVQRYSNDEIGELAVAFNEMVQDLSKARKELNNSNENLSSANNTLQSTLTDLQATQAQLIHAEKMASLGELTAGIAHEIQNPLNFINNFSEVSIDLSVEMKEELDLGNIDAAKAIADDLEKNMEKINHHGRRADFIVKGMLQHSRATKGERLPTNINVLADEFLKLSYHGLRARDKSFNAGFTTDFDENLPKINIVQQDVGRVLLNLFNNAFYAVQQKQKKADVDYKPEVFVGIYVEDNKLIIKVRDNGNGIPAHILDKIYQPFFTTKPTGEGTGLGLSLSYEIIKAHGGKIEVKASEGEFAEFIIMLPV